MKPYCSMMRVLLPAMLIARAAALAEFAIISSLEEAKVYYQALPSFKDMALHPNKKLETPNVLIGDLPAPQGLVYYRNSALLVSDSETEKIYMYDLIMDTTNMKLAVGNRVVLLEKIAGGARWMYDDNLGNVYYTVESTSEIMSVSAKQILEAQETKHPIIHPTALYQGGSEEKVSSPSAIVVDDFFLYWGNKENGGSRGSVVAGYTRAMAHPEDEQFPKALATNENKVYGLCVVDREIYYTAPEAMYAVNKNGGEPKLVSRNEMTAPRGCSYDGDGTVYVADKGTNAIYTFPAHRAGTLRLVKRLKKIIDVQAPIEIILLNSAVTLSAVLWLLLI